MSISYNIQFDILLCLVHSKAPTVELKIELQTYLNNQTRHNIIDSLFLDPPFMHGIYHELIYAIIYREISLWNPTKNDLL